jgi:alkylhydroperoxidase family enzyme
MMRISVQQSEGHEGAILPHGPRPQMAAAMEALAAAVYQETTLSFREAEGARIRIAHINGCLMCQGFRIAEQLPAALLKMNSREGANSSGSRGEAPTEQFYEAAARGYQTFEGFSARERLAVEFAERVALEPDPLPYDDEFWGRLQSHFTADEIVDLTYSVTTWIATGRAVHVLGLDAACAAPVGAAAR